MKINKHWNLDAYFYPYDNYDTPFAGGASRKQFDSVTIIHYQNEDFTPIVLCENAVRSESYHPVKEFYRGVLYLLIKDFRHEDISGFRTFYSRLFDEYTWGCRTFTRKQLLLIKRTMEWHYGKENLV